MTIAVGSAWRSVPADRSRVVAGDRDLAIDTMRGVAIVMVIGIHSLAIAKVSPPLIVIDAVLRPCVPVFLFASGYLTIGAKRVPLARRLWRVAVPYTIAFVFAYALIAWTNPHMDQRPIVTMARYGLAYVFVYYYVFVYVGCTITLWCVYRLARVGGALDRSRLLVLLAIAIPIGLAFGAYVDPLWRRAGLPAGLIEEVRMRDIPFWFGFVALGALVGGTGARSVLRDLRHLLVALTIAAYAAYAAIRVWRVGDAADYDSLAFFLYAALFCLTMLGFAFEGETLAFLGSASYFIYLWHIFVIMILRDVPLFRDHGAVAIPILFVSALIVSGTAAWAVRRYGSPRVARWLGAR